MRGVLKVMGLKRCALWLRRNWMFSLSLLAAAVTALFVPPDREYIGYFDLKTLVCLFGVLTVIGALRNAGFFDALARRIVASSRNLRGAVLTLTLITLAGSMFMTNDVALIAFLPLGWLVLRDCGHTRALAFLFVLMTLAANLGGMLLPFGNPQNLYLFSHYGIPAGEFLAVMLPPFALSAAGILLVCLFVRREPVALPAADIKTDIRRTAVYLGLFLIVILAVFRALPYAAGLLAPAALLFLDRKALREADYPLLGTFCAFFVFSGNLARIPAVHAFLGAAVAKSALLTGIATSQVISNVPAAVLLSQFTENYADLLVAVNVGGVGTPIASLASLITLKAYLACEPKEFANEPGGVGRFMKLFLLLNFAFLAALTAACLLLRGL